MLSILAATTASAEEAAVTEEPSNADYAPPATVDGAHFFEPFIGGWSRWQISSDEEFSGEWKHEEYGSLPNDHGLVVGSEAKRHAISTIFEKPFDPKGTGMVIQYELHTKTMLQCGGAYLKLLSASEELSTNGFHASTPYTIMFGPDKCGNTNKVHFILRHKSPKTGEWEEKHLASPPIPKMSDTETHLYTAIVGADNSVKILVDGTSVKEASLLTAEDFEPPVNPPKEIDDPEDTKPEEWIDDPKMADPETSKPDDWDEDAPAKIDDPEVSKPEAWLDDAPLEVSDPDAAAPDDWDADEDGDWEAPMVPNPACKEAGCGEWKAPVIMNPEYKGKWSAPLVDNPDYKGQWGPAQIANPNFFVDETPHAMAPIGGIGIEIWTMQDGITFDNILLTSDAESATAMLANTFNKRQAADESKAKKARKAESNELEKEPGMKGAIKYYLLKVLYAMMNNFAISLAMLSLGLCPLIYFFCIRGKESDDAPVVAPPVYKAPPKEEEEGEEQEEETEKKKPVRSSPRKRTAKAN